MQKTMTSFDLAAVVIELREQLPGAHVQNIYQKRRAFILKLHRSGQPAISLLIEPGKRLHLTSYLIEKPQTPPAFCMVLRRYLRNSVIAEVSQHEFERIVILKARTKEGEKRLIVELFGDGNIILVDSQNLIQQALVLKRMRDRNILPGEPYQHAPSSGKNPLCLDLRDLAELKKSEGMETVRALTRLLGIGGMYAEEALLRARIDKNKKCESLSDEELKRIFGALQELVQPLTLGRLDPCIIFDEKGKWMDAVPMPLKRYESLDCRKFKSVNEALDEFYTKAYAEQEKDLVAGEFEEENARQQRILDEQKESLERAKREAENMRKIADKIYAHFHQLQALTQRIMSEKKEQKTWQEIASKIEEEKKRGETPAIHFQSLDARNLTLTLSIDNLSFPLLLRDSVQENAATYYNRAKKAKKKAEGAEKAIKETLRSMGEIKKRGEVAVESVTKPAKKERKTWYQKFRWFHTSEGLLVVGGKDAVSNEVLIKRHTGPHDMVFHADIDGAPFVIMKAEGKAPSQQSISEAAQLAASHSRAWKTKFSAIDVYWVQLDQLSKTPPSGEYLSKGAFMVKGKKNYVRKTPLRLAIGIDAKATPPLLVGGPIEAIKTKTVVYVEIVPGDLSSRELAGRIKHTLNQKISKELREQVSRIPLEEIQALIPFGKGSMTNQQNGKRYG